MIVSGNAATDGEADNGWFIGYFFEGRDQRRTRNDIEFKLGLHNRGERRSKLSRDARSTLSLLIQGEFRIIFPDQTVYLRNLGDYVLWEDITHGWQAVEDSVLLTARWPSQPSRAS